MQGTARGHSTGGNLIWLDQDQTRPETLIETQARPARSNPLPLQGNRKVLTLIFSIVLFANSNTTPLDRPSR
jgi:hypothetical protein